ncbi:MAG: V-type ATP synthase subunit F [Nitrososphaerota archaeon]|nr:V-type ATP synthase subunit F [Candidatus Calditenuaceae archaeon]MDW8073247.1 V-type ATP synthase subunit F [Nitrososphaerota archaeon]
MRAVAVGGELFVASFRIAGLGGVVARDGKDAIRIIEELAGDSEVGLILVSDEFGPEFAERVEQLSSTRPSPVIYLLPRPGEKPSVTDYRALLRRILSI